MRKREFVIVGVRVYDLSSAFFICARRTLTIFRFLNFWLVYDRVAFTVLWSCLFWNVACCSVDDVGDVSTRVET